MLYIFVCTSHVLPMTVILVVWTLSKVEASISNKNKRVDICVGGVIVGFLFFVTKTYFKKNAIF